MSRMRYDAWPASITSRPHRRGVPLQRHALRLRTLSPRCDGAAAVARTEMGRLDRGVAADWLGNRPESTSPVVLGKRPLRDRMPQLQLLRLHPAVDRADDRHDS